jgi:SAM-dependent methyltransferase
LKGGDWNSTLPTEVLHCEKIFEGGWRNMDPAEWRDCRDPNLELREELKALIPAPAGSVVRILDVGSGPLTRVGKRWAGRQLEVVAADPLAEQYNALMQRYSVAAPVPVTFAHGEKLLETFAPDSFDLVHASNSLDHTYDPVAAIGQMLAVVKPQHCVYLWHVANEGLREGYQGLHQWNFDIRGSDFVVHDGRRTQSITAAYKAKAEMTYEFRDDRGVKTVVAKLKKIG